MPAPKHSPLAVDTPTLSPVYEPGPMLTHTALQSDTFIPVSFSISSMNTAVSEACSLGFVLSLYDMIFPSDAMAAEHSSVEVSMRIMFSIYLVISSLR